jgi:hypothetical protein
MFEPDAYKLLFNLLKSNLPVVASKALFKCNYNSFAALAAYWIAVVYYVIVFAELPL